MAFEYISNPTARDLARVTPPADYKHFHKFNNLLKEYLDKPEFWRDLLMHHFNVAHVPSNISAKEYFFVVLENKENLPAGASSSTTAIDESFQDDEETILLGQHIENAKAAFHSFLSKKDVVNAVTAFNAVVMQYGAIGHYTALLAVQNYLKTAVSKEIAKELVEFGLQQLALFNETFYSATSQQGFTKAGWDKEDFKHMGITPLPFFNNSVTQMLSNHLNSLQGPSAQSQQASRDSYKPVLKPHNG